MDTGAQQEYNADTGEGRGHNGLRYRKLGDMVKSDVEGRCYERCTKSRMWTKIFGQKWCEGTE